MMSTFVKSCEIKCINGQKLSPAPPTKGPLIV